MTSTIGTAGRDRDRLDHQAHGIRAVADLVNPTFPISTRSLEMLLLNEELARAQIAQRHAEMAHSVRLARLAAARRRQRRAASAQRRVRLSLAAAR
ncbi:MAG: hypothetical protein ACJ74O_12295 [Frankiaceae bacterium]